MRECTSLYCTFGCNCPLSDWLSECYVATRAYSCTMVVLSKVRKQVFEDSTEAAYIFTYEGSHWLRYLIGCAASPLARRSLAHACEVPFPYRGPRTVLLIALTSTI